MQLCSCKTHNDRSSVVKNANDSWKYDKISGTVTKTTKVTEQQAQGIISTQMVMCVRSVVFF